MKRSSRIGTLGILDIYAQNVVGAVRKQSIKKMLRNVPLIEIFIQYHAGT